MDLQAAAPQGYAARPYLPEAIPCCSCTAENGAEVILGVRNTDAGEKLAKEIM